MSTAARMDVDIPRLANDRSYSGPVKVGRDRRPSATSARILTEAKQRGFKVSKPALQAAGTEELAHAVARDQDRIDHNAISAYRNALGSTVVGAVDANLAAALDGSLSIESAEYVDPENLRETARVERLKLVALVAAAGAAERYAADLLRAELPKLLEQFEAKWPETLPISDADAADMTVAALAAHNAAGVDFRDFVQRTLVMAEGAEATKAERRALAELFDALPKDMPTFETVRARAAGNKTPAQRNAEAASVRKAEAKQRNATESAAMAAARLGGTNNG